MADEASSSLRVAIYRGSAADLLGVPEAVVDDGLPMAAIRPQRC
jgi:hypothetical protein